METKVIESAKFSLNWRDLWRGLLIAVIAPLVPILYGLFDSWSQGLNPEFNWRVIVGTGIKAGLAYLALNFFSNSKVIAVTGKTKLKSAANKIKNTLT